MGTRLTAPSRSQPRRSQTSATIRHSTTPLSQPTPHSVASRKGSRVFFPDDNRPPYRQHSSQSREEAHSAQKPPAHPGTLPRYSTSRPSAPPLPLKEEAPQVSPEPDSCTLESVFEPNLDTKQEESTQTTQPPPFLQPVVTKRLTFSQRQGQREMDPINPIDLENEIQKLVQSEEEQRVAEGVKRNIGILLQNLRRLEQENTLLRRTGGGRGPGADAAGDIAALQEEITNYRNQVQGLEEKNDELYKVNHEWSEEYKNMRKSLTEQIKKLEGEKDALERQIAKLDADLNETDGTTELLIRKLKASNALLAQEKEGLNRNCEDLDNERTKLTKRLNTLEKLYEEDVNDELAAKEQIRDLAITIREMKDKEKKHVNEYRVLDDRVTELQDQLRKAKSQHKGEKDLREKAEKELKKANKAFKEIKKEIFEQLNKDHYSPPLSSKDRKRMPKYPPRYAFGPAELAAEKKLSKRLASLAPWDEDFSVLEDCIPSKEGYNYSETSEDEFY